MFWQVLLTNICKISETCWSIFSCNCRKNILAYMTTFGYRISIREYIFVYFKIYAFPHFDTEQWILSLTYWVGVSGAQKDIYGGQSETFLRRLQQEWFSPLDNGKWSEAAAGSVSQHIQFGNILGCLIGCSSRYMLPPLSNFMMSTPKIQARSWIDAMRQRDFKCWPILLESAAWTRYEDWSGDDSTRFYMTALYEQVLIELLIVITIDTMICHFSFLFLFMFFPLVLRAT